MQVSHPAEWEAAVLSARDQPGRCAFADRYYHRLDVRWRGLTYVPDLELLLTKHRRRAAEGLDLRETTGLPPGWRGIEQKTETGLIARAARFFPQPRWMVEATVVWPGRRDRRLESVILESIRPEDPQADPRRWQALGLNVRLGRAYDLYQSSLQVGLVRWVFRTDPRRGPELAVERLAMPSAWLEQPLRDWLVEQLPLGAKTRRQEMATCNGHRGERLISWATASRLAALRGRRKVRLDLAWLCPAENRLYRIGLTEATTEEEISLPAALAVRCCQPVPAPGVSRTDG